MFHPALVLVSSGFDRFFLLAISRSLPCAHGVAWARRMSATASEEVVQCSWVSGAVQWVKVGFSCFFLFTFLSGCVREAVVGIAAVRAIFFLYCTFFQLFQK
jgi:hypothetical protein